MFSFLGDPAVNIAIMIRDCIFVLRCFVPLNKTEVGDTFMGWAKLTIFDWCSFNVAKQPHTRFHIGQGQACTPMANRRRKCENISTAIFPTVNCANSSIDCSHKAGLRIATFCQLSHRFHLANSSTLWPMCLFSCPFSHAVSYTYI